MKKIRRIGAMVLLLCLALSLGLSGCASSAPEVAQIYDVVVELVERSYAANDLLFGYGIPVHAIDSELAALNYLYSDAEFADYEYAHELSPYMTIGEIKSVLESVYSKEYLASHYTTLFDGFMMGDRVVRARYYEEDEWLFQSVDSSEPLITWQRIYDYSTMRVIKPSNASYVTVEIDTHLENDDVILPVQLSIVYTEDGWRLDAPTY